MGDFYDAATIQAMNNISQVLRASGVNLGDELDAIRSLLTSGNLGIEASADDVDAIVKANYSSGWNGQFTRDLDAGDGTSLVFGWKASRIYNGLAIVPVAAGTLTLSASNSNYIQVDAAGVVTANTIGFASDGSKMPLWKVIAGSSTYSDGNVFNAKPLLYQLFKGTVVGSLLSTAGATKEAQIYAGDISATTIIPITLPNIAGTINRITIANKAAQSADDTNYWTFGVINKGPSGSGTTVVADGTAAANSTKTTGGSAMTGYVKRALTLTATGADLIHAAEDVAALTLTKNSAAANLTGVVVRVDSVFTG